MAPINEAFGRRARDVWDRFVIDLASPARPVDVAA